MRSEPRDSSTRGAIVLLVAAALAVAWASSPWGASYEALWQRHLAGRFAGHGVDVSLRFAVDEGLMTVFFFAVGLEIRHEIHAGVLSEWRRAVVPIVAAIGGMIAPAILYFTLNHSGPERAGWGVPVATDIAFAVGVLALLGRRVPPALRVLLLALAIIDDIGAIIVIALFYSSGIALTGFIVAACGVALVIGLQMLGARSPWAFVVPGAVLWFGVLRAGVHPTIAGVLLGLLTPAAVAPRLVARLAPWVAFGIMPLFALANAGVAIRARALDGGMLLPLGIVLGLVVGKPAGIVVVTWLVTRTRFATLPHGITGAGLLVLGCVAGIGFTMSIFIASLAFAGSPMLETAKLAILAASVLAGTIALVVGRLVLRQQPEA